VPAALTFPVQQQDWDWSTWSTSWGTSWQQPRGAADANWKILNLTEPPSFPVCGPAKQKPDTLCPPMRIALSCLRSRLPSLRRLKGLRSQTAPEGPRCLSKLAAPNLVSGRPLRGASGDCGQDVPRVGPNRGGNFGHYMRPKRPKRKRHGHSNGLNLRQLCRCTPGLSLSRSSIGCHQGLLRHGSRSHSEGMHVPYCPLPSGIHAGGSRVLHSSAEIPPHWALLQLELDVRLPGGAAPGSDHLVALHCGCIHELSPLPRRPAARSSDELE
jgi:hypothetical protein